jgi:cytoskeletal protein CcmA (bactofilin family)
MFRIDNTTAVGIIPAVPAAGTPGYFTKGNPATGIDATIVDDWWLNTVQEEIITVVVNAGLTLNKNDRTQLYQAIVQIAAGFETPIPPLNFLPLTGGQLHSPATSNLLTLYVDTGYYNEIIYTTGITRQWSVGLDPSGNFVWTDVTGNATRMSLTVADGALNVAGQIKGSNSATIAGGISTGTISATGNISSNLTVQGLNLVGTSGLFVAGQNPIYSASAGWLNMSNNFNITGSFIAGGSIQGGSLNITGASTIAGTATFNGTANFVGINVGSQANLNSNVHIGGSLTIGGLSAIYDGGNNYLTTGGNVNIGGTCQASYFNSTGSAAIAWAFNVGGPAGFSNNVTINGSTSCNDLTLNGTLWIGGSGGVGGSLTLSGNFGANSGTFGGNLSCGLVLSVSGNANIAGDVHCNQLYTNSDDRRKTNVAPLDPQEMLDAVKTLRPSSYTLRGRRSFGFVAQEVKGTDLGDAVVTGPHGLQIDHNHLMAAMACAIQRLDARVAALGG